MPVNCMNPLHLLPYTSVELAVVCDLHDVVRHLATSHQCPQPPVNHQSLNTCTCVKILFGVTFSWCHASCIIMEVHNYVFCSPVLNTSAWITDFIQQQQYYYYYYFSRSAMGVMLCSAYAGKLDCGLIAILKK